MIDICGESAENRVFCCLFAASAMCCFVLCCVLTVVGCGVVFHISLLLYYLFKIFKIVYDDDDGVWIVWIFPFLSCWGGV